MRTIALGFDGTDPSFVALEWAADRAARIGACRVEIITVDAAALFAHEVIDVALRDAERRVRDRAPDADVSSSAKAGRMPGALVRAASTADLLVIGSHRRRSSLMAWRPMRTAAMSSVPVVVVPEDWSGADGVVLVGVDEDDSSLAAVDLAAAEAASTGAGLAMVHAWRTPGPLVDGSVALLVSPLEERSRHRRILESAAGRALAAHPDLDVRKVLVQADATTALLEEARRSRLLVLGTHHRGPVSSSILGSVGRGALVRSRIPVVVVPIAGVEADRGRGPDAVDRLPATGDGRDRERVRDVG